MKRALQSLIRLFPADFRDEFGEAMSEQIARDHDRARSRGAPATLWFTLATAWDLVHSALAERWNPTWTNAHMARAEDEKMRSIGRDWWRDLRYAARSLRRSPGFTAVTVGTLGLAIGVNAGMFSIVDTVLLDPLPYANVDRVVHIGATAPGSGLPDEIGVSAEFYVHYRERSKLLEDISTYNSFTNTMRAGDRVERIRMSWPTNTLFSTLGARPILGRLPVASDGEGVVVISHALWTSWFGNDPSVIGRSYHIGGAMRTIVGVMGQDFRFPTDDVQLWISSEIRAEGITPGRFGNPLVARMKPGVTTEMLANELTALSKELPARFGGPATYAKVIEQHRAVVRAIEEQVLGDVARPLFVLLGAVGVVLLIACANVANLFMVRAEGRQRELAIRRAIGAGRVRLIQAQMAEAMVVAALAAALAVGLAALTLPAFLGAVPEGVPRLMDIRLDATTVTFALGAAILAAVLCGLIPALRASAPDLARLREGGRTATRRANWARDGLVVAQTALALVLLIASGLLVRSFRSLHAVDPGYETEDIFTFQIAPEGAHLVDGPSYARFHLDFMEKLATLPGVETVGLVENIPLNEGTAVAPFMPEGKSAPDDTRRLNFTFAAGDYFQAMGIALIGGRSFERDDHLQARRTVVVSRKAADALWPGENPIGKRLQRQGLESWETVVGVVEDVMQNNFRDSAEPLVYFPMVGPAPRSWVISSPAYVLKTSRAETIASDVRALVRSVAPTAPMYRTFTMAGLAAESTVAVSFTMLTLGIVSTLALILGAVGLYGVLSYVVVQRTREIGVRMALGAEAGRVRRMVVVQGTRVVAIGVVIGIAGALLSTRALGSLLFGVEAIDAATFVAMSASMLAIGLLASYVPARRASRVDPIESLRGE